MGKLFLIMLVSSIAMIILGLSVPSWDFWALDGLGLLFITLVLGIRLAWYALVIRFAARNWYTGRDQHYGR